MNNPLLYTDPSEFNWLQKLNFWSDKVGASPSLLFGRDEYNRGFNWLQGSGGYQLKSAVISFFSAWCGWGAWACNAGGQAGLARAYGASDSDAVKTGAIAGASTAMFQAAGSVGGDSNTAGRYMAHAAAGCGSSVVAGGGSSGCARGAAAAVIGKAVTNYTTENNWGTVGSGVAAVTAGGVTSQMMGGTFANGATTAAYGYLFNEMLHQGDRRAAQQRSGYKESIYSDGTVCNGNGGSPCYGGSNAYEPGVSFVSIGASGTTGGYSASVGWGERLYREPQQYASLHTWLTILRRLLGCAALTANLPTTASAG